jgi:hypothetical protein
MKQCPNPNCIYYTRLEELPDAYVRCPGCGGLLVDADMQSGKLRSGKLRLPPGLSIRDLDQEFEEAFPGGSPTGPLAGVPSADEAAAYGGAEGYAEGEYYPYDQSQEYVVDPAVGSAPLSLMGKIGYILGGLLLLGACGLFMVVLFTRVIPQQGAATGPGATQTALVAQHPAVNTPISELPTASSLPAVAPTVQAIPPQPTATSQPAQPTQPEPTAVAAEPTQPPPPPPSATPAPPQPTAPVNATAPPAQEQATGGVLDAFMTNSVQSGQSLDRVTTYGASDAFVLSVQAEFGAGGITTVRTRWYGPDNGLLYELPRSYTLEGTYYSTFTLKKDSPWLEGNYRVDIYTNASTTPAYSLHFAVAP